MWMTSCAFGVSSMGQHLWECGIMNYVLQGSLATEVVSPYFVEIIRLDLDITQIIMLSEVRN